MLSTRLRPDIALAALLMLTAPLVGCGGDDQGPQAATAEGEAAEQPLDGDGMEPRIVTEHPMDAPGRPADGERAAVAIEAEPAAAWVPHLTARDLEASVEFYRQLGFEVGPRQADERVELARDGVRLVLVAAPDGAGEDGAGDGAEAGTEAPAGDGAAPVGSSPVVLHLVDEATGEGGPTVRDPDGHRVALPAGG